MKKPLICILSFLSMLSFAQDNNLLRDDMINLLNSKPRTVTDADVEGSVFYNKEYRMAQVIGVEGKWPIRYDAFRDEIEVKKDKDVFALKKEAPFNEINFADKDEKIILTEYDLDNKKQTGYLFEVLATPAAELYKKQTIAFKKGKEANTTLEISTPNRFLMQDPVYFIKEKSGSSFIQLDKKAKQLLVQHPDKKVQVKKCTKESSFNLSNEMSIKSFVKCLYN